MSRVRALLGLSVLICCCSQVFVQATAIPSLVVAAGAPRSQALPDGTTIPGIDARWAHRFIEMRRNELAFLENEAAQAGRGSGEDMGAFAARVAAEFDAYAQAHGGSTETAFQDFAHDHYAAARFLMAIDKYRLMVRSNIFGATVVIGTEFDGWELDNSYLGWKTRFSARQLGGAVYSGLEMADGKGVRRFDGEVMNGSARQLVVIFGADLDEETQTVLDATDGRRIINRTVFKTSTGECLLREDF